jgi:hypothetical protein
MLQTVACCQNFPHILKYLLPAWPSPSHGIKASSMSCQPHKNCMPRVCCQENDCQVACAGEAVTPDVKGWDDLPYDMLELILGKLSVREVARMSATCSMFLAVCRRRLAQDQKIRCEVAAGFFGHGVLIYLALLIHRFVNGDPLDQEVVEKNKQAKWVLPQTFHLHDTSRNIRRTERVYQAGDMHVGVTLGNMMNTLVLCLPTLMGPIVCLHTRRFSPKLFNITMSRAGEGESFGIVEGMAFLQALVSGAWAPLSSEPSTGVTSDVCIGRHFFESKFKKEDLDTLQIGSLLPGVSSDTFAILGVGCPSMVKERMQVKQIGWRMPAWPWPIPAERPFPSQVLNETLYLVASVHPVPEPVQNPKKGRRGWFLSFMKILFC